MNDVSLRRPARARGGRLRVLVLLLQRFGAAAAVFLLFLAFLQWGVPALGIPFYILPTPTAETYSRSWLGHHFITFSLRSSHIIFLATQLAQP